jgi:hypothetical protein
MGLSRMDNPETLTTLGTQDTGQRQSRDTDNIGYTRHRKKTIQRHWQHWVHKTKTIQRHWQHWVHKTQDKDNPEILTTLGTQDEDNPETLTTLGTQDEDNPETLTTLGTQDTGRRHNKTNNTTQKTKMKSNTDPTKNLGWTEVLAKSKQFLPLIDTCHVTHLVNMCWTSLQLGSIKTK